MTNTTQRAERQTYSMLQKDQLTFSPVGGHNFNSHHGRRQNSECVFCSVFCFSGLKSFAMIKTGKINSKDANFMNKDSPSENSGQIKGEHNKTDFRANGVRNANTVLLWLGKRTYLT